MLFKDMSAFKCKNFVEPEIVSWAEIRWKPVVVKSLRQKLHLDK